MQPHWMRRATAQTECTGFLRTRTRVRQQQQPRWGWSCCGMWKAVYPRSTNSCTPRTTMSWQVCAHVIALQPRMDKQGFTKLCNWLTQFTGFICANDTPVAVLQSSDLIHSYCVAKKSHADSLNAATRHISPYATLSCSFECPLHYLGQSQRPGRSSSCMPA